ncbi:MAG: CHAT domain-containing protein [Cyanobacteria bacterium J06632_22]
MVKHIADKQIAIAATLGALIIPRPVLAQSITPSQDGLGTQVQQTGTAYSIDGGTVSGTNLFHSFGQFGLTPGETATFLTQPDILNVLGRINGGEASIINGQLQLVGSNANLFLINPVGVLFGPNVQLNLPSNLTVATADSVAFGQGLFNAVGPIDPTGLTGPPQGLLFRGASGPVVNTGTLTLGEGQTLLLAGGSVINTGTLATAAGEIAIAAVPEGNQLRLTPSGSLLSYDVDPGATSGLTPVGLPELLTGQQDLGPLHVQDGRAQLAQVAIPTEVGTVIVSGVLNVSSTNGTGGSLTITGDTTGVIGALLTAAGQGGGEIYVGGSVLGQGPLPNAQVTYIDELSVLDASAEQRGDGGRVIVWSDQTTRSYGSISVGGGSRDGNGGFVETSSGGFLDVGAAVPDILAPAGTAGTWLIDPHDLSIANTTGFGVTPVSPFVPTIDSAVLATTTLETALNAGGLVIVSTLGTLGTEEGKITLVDQITYDPTIPSELRLLATGSIQINANIVPAFPTSGALTLTFTADGGNSGLGQVVLGNSTATTLNTNGGNVVVQANSTNLIVTDSSAVLVPNGTTINTTNPFAGTDGNISLTGVANNRPGVFVEAGATLNAQNGAIALTGTSNSDSGVLINGTLTNDDTPLIITGNSSSPTLFGVHIDGGILTNIGNLTVVGNNPNNVGIQFSDPVTANAIQLSSDRDIEVASLTTLTGNLVANAGRFFRATNAGISLDSTTGSITVRHGGNGITPFIVGNSNVNGTAGVIRATGGNVLIPTQSFLERFIQGNISILTDNPVAILEAFLENSPGFLECLGSCLSQAVSVNAEGTLQGVLADGPQFSILDRPRALQQLFETFTRLEGNYANEYTTYLGLDANNFPEPSLPEIQENLTLVAEATGIRPAIVYVSFAPLTEQDPEQQVSPGSPVQRAAHPKGDRWGPSEIPHLPTASAAQPDDLLELILVAPGGTPIRKSLNVTHQQVQTEARRLRREVSRPSRVGSQTYRSAAQQLYDWVIAPLETELQEEDIGNLAFVMAPGLRSLPVSALHDGNGFLIERYSVGLVPSISLTDLRYVDVRNSEVLAMGASSFEDQPELPAVPIELTTIAEQLWPGDFLLNETFTPARLVSRRQQKPYGIVHLATHGEFSEGQVEDSYIQFWDQRLGIDEVRSLQLSNPPVELMVLSACRTALGSETAELGFAGLAVQAGVKTALASLWKVDDIGTAGLMTQFYTSLRKEPIKAEALRQAQLAMLNGEIAVQNGKLVWAGGELSLPPELATLSPEVFEHPFFWSAFTVIGSPW